MSSLERTHKIKKLEQQLQETKEQLSFLKDSDEFYEFPLGLNDQTVFIPTFHSPGNANLISVASNETKKLTEEWYLNYAGFLPEEADIALAVSRYLKAYMKMFRIHKFLYPELYTSSQQGQIPTNLTGVSAFKWVIRYNWLGNFFEAVNVSDQTAQIPKHTESLFMFRGASTDVGYSDFADEFEAYSGQPLAPILTPYHEFWSPDAWKAIKWMFNEEGLDIKLRSLFKVENIKQTKFL